jgi:hypothetical protein
MGLLDKVDNKGDSKPVAKKATPKKAVAKKATPKKAVAKKATPKKAEASESKPKAVKIRPSGLPEGYELAGKMPRYVGWLVNFAWNYGALLGTMSIFMFGDPDMTWPFLAAGLMIIANWLVIPIWQGRNIGEFVSRTKYINSSGNKPLFIHAVMNNSLGLLVLLGIIFIFTGWQDISTSSGATYVGMGTFFLLLWVVNAFFKKNSDFSQGIFDMAFSAYLVRHVASGSETGWLARFEGLGDFGDKWQQRQAERADKAAEKATAKEAAALEDAESEEDSNDESEKDSAD